MFTPGDVSGSYQLTDDDHLYNTHINELRRQSGGVYNALYYGSTMSGVEIQAAIDAASAAGGGTVLIPSGTWTVAAALSVPSNVKIMGDGDSTIVRPVITSYLKVFINSDTVGGNTNIEICDLTIDGRNSELVYNNPGSFAHYGIYFSKITDLKINNVKIINFWAGGIWLDYITRLNVNKVKILDCWFSGLDINYNCRWQTISDCFVYGTIWKAGLFSHAYRCNGTDAVYTNCIAYHSGDAGFGVGLWNFANRAKRISLINCMSVDCRDFPFYVGYAENCKVVGCYASMMDEAGGWSQPGGSAGGGIGFAYVDGLVISDNICVGNGMSGILCSDQGADFYADHIVISNNVCMNNGGVGTTQAGIFLYAESAAYLRECTVTGNICGDNQVTPTQWTGIRTSTGTNYKHIISNNVCFGNKASGMTIALAGPTMSIIQGNACYNNGRTEEGHGIAVTNPENSIISNNICTDNQAVHTQYYGIYVVGPYFSVINGNQCFQNKRHGIYITGGLQSTIGNNACYLNSQETINTYSGIELLNTTYCTLTANSSVGAQHKYGIETTGTSNYNVVLGNILNGNATATGVLAGANNENAHNIPAIT